MGLSQRLAVATLVTSVIGHAFAQEAPMPAPTQNTNIGSAPIQQNVLVPLNSPRIIAKSEPSCWGEGVYPALQRVCLSTSVVEQEEVFSSNNNNKDEGLSEESPPASASLRTLKNVYAVSQLCRTTYCPIVKSECHETRAPLIAYDPARAP